MPAPNSLEYVHIDVKSYFCQENNPYKNIVNYFPIQSHRYILSHVLIFLNECDGTSFLLTNKLWTHRFLHIFQLPEESVNVMTMRLTNKTSMSKIRVHQARHKFVLFPVQDTSTLLARLNTIRLHKRIKQNNIVPNYCTLYKMNRTTEEISWLEWYDSVNNFLTFKTTNVRTELLRFCYPSPLSSFGLSVSLFPQLLHGITVLASYPRSGNSLLRMLLERITNTITGSDTCPNRSLSRQLSKKLVGEGIIGPSTVCNIIKTHWPERRGCLPFKCHRIILLVRNPYDVIDSYWNMCCTSSHDESVTDPVYYRYKNMHRNLARHEIEIWTKFNNYWIMEGMKKGLPVLIVRYEDLMLDALSTMERVINFMTVCHEVNKATKLDKFWRWRVRVGLGINHEHLSYHTETHIDDYERYRHKQRGVDTIDLGSYTPRCCYPDQEENSNISRYEKTCIYIGKALRKDRYSEETLRFMHDRAASISLGNKNWLEFCGYDIYNQHFPLNFESNSYPPIENLMTKCLDFTNKMYEKNNARTFMRVNVGNEIREQSDPYGRAMFDWRRRETQNGTNCFPTINK